MSGFGDLHDELRSVARDLLGKGSAPDWRLLAASGWLGLEVPDALGGAGATFAEVAVVLEEMGRAATVSPYLGTVVLGAGALALLEPGPGRDGLLRQVAAGDVRLAVALATGDDIAVPFRIEGGRLHGRAELVPDAPEADRLLLLALDADDVPVVVPADPPVPAGPHDPGGSGGSGSLGVEVTAQPVLDATRRFGGVTADGVVVEEVWRFAGDPEAAVRRLGERAALAVACDSLGLSEAMLDATVAYAGVRQQFGRPIGSFQAVKHACADMLVGITVARELLSVAVQGLVGGEPEAAVAVAMAKSYVCGAAVDIVGKALQLHGGIGYTWESGIHVYLKRAALDRSLFGSPRAHRKRLAERFVPVV